jgi:hypothetical protein
VKTIEFAIWNNGSHRFSWPPSLPPLVTSFLKGPLGATFIRRIWVSRCLYIGRVLEQKFFTCRSKLHWVFLGWQLFLSPALQKKFDGCCLFWSVCVFYSPCYTCSNPQHQPSWLSVVFSLQGHKGFWKINPQVARTTKWENLHLLAPFFFNS